MTLNRGSLLERQFIASLPAGRVWVRKLHTPPATGPLIAYIKSVNQGRVPDRLLGVLHSTFTPTQPFDLLVTAPAKQPHARDGEEYHAEVFNAPSGGDFELIVRPSVVFAFELKSCGDARNLPFDRVKPHQLDGLLEAASRGIVAGLLIEFPEVGPHGELYFVPVQLFASYRAGAERASFPLAAAHEHGILIEPDLDRGRVHRFWKAGELLRHFGADLPPTRPHQAAREPAVARL